MSEREQIEYEQMRLFNIFSDDEILKIHKARKIFESRIIQPDKEIKDFLEYIKYERKLISTSKERFLKLKIMEENTIVPLVAVHIKQLYSEALLEFPQNTRFWDEYIKFLQQFKFHRDISEAFDRMLEIHSDKPEVWSRAIQWEHHENDDDEEEDRIVDLIKRAQEQHPESLTLYLTLFQIELENKRKRDLNKAIEHAEEVYANGKTRFPQIEFYIEMLKIVDKLSYARPIQQAILEDMRETFSKSEILWHTLAQRELHGLTVNENLSNSMEDIKEEDEDSKSSFSKSQSSDISVSLKPMRKRIELCLKTYMKAIEHVDSERMWTYFLNCMLELNKDLSTQSSMKKYALNEAFRLANTKSAHMTEDHYAKYLGLLHTDNPTDDSIEQVLANATTIHKTSVELWLQRLRFYIQKKNFAKIKEIFLQARGHLGSKGAEIWRWYLIYIKSHRTPPGELDRFIVDLSQQRNSAFYLVKSHIIELLGNTSNTQRALDACELFIQNDPDCEDYGAWKKDLVEKKAFEFNMGDCIASRNGSTDLEMLKGRKGRKPR